MRLIKDSEIREMAEMMAECFVDYPLYRVFFPNDEKKKTRVFYFFWYRLYTRKACTYITSEKDMIISFQKPEDKLKSSAGLWLNPAFLFGFLKNIPLRAIKLVLEFGKMETQFWKLYYNPLTDCYAHAACVLKKSRGNGVLLQVLKELDDGRPIFCETHTPQNVELYEYLGMEVCARTDWHGVPHYVMKKRGSYIRVSGPLKEKQ